MPGLTVVLVSWGRFSTRDSVCPAWDWSLVGSVPGTTPRTHMVSLSEAVGLGPGSKPVYPVPSALELTSGCRRRAGGGEWAREWAGLG